MKQYLDLMRHVRDNGTTKTDRTGTGTQSVFGYQMRFNLQEGFPLVTTKKTNLKSIIHELIWFLAGDTNIKYLTDNGVNIWNEWADPNGELGPVYGAQWRHWDDTRFIQNDDYYEKDKWEKYANLGYNCVAELGDKVVINRKIDQISDTMDLLKNNPDSRRIMVSAWNVGDLSSMRLMPCHSMFQFYVVDLTVAERGKLIGENLDHFTPDTLSYPAMHRKLDSRGVPDKKLSCQLYQRSLH